ncbi:MAG: helix-turn-helix transcriptional regulator [Gemmatimonadota bacterium]
MTAPLSDLEVLALASVMRLGDEAYGVAIKNDIADRTGRDVSIGSLYKALARLEGRGYVTAFTGAPTAVRGGRAKKHVRIEAEGRAALEAALQSLARMVDGLDLKWKPS